MDTLFSYSVQGKLYRLWYELYRDAQIKVKTGAGMTAVEATVENVAQGSIGGALLPHSAYLGISAKLKICQVSACKIGHNVALYSEGTNQPGPLSFEQNFLSTHSSYLTQISNLSLGY